MDYDREFYPIYSVVMLFPVVNVTYFNVKMQKLSLVIPFLIPQSDGVLTDENSVVIKVCTCHKNSGNFKKVLNEALIEEIVKMIDVGTNLLEVLFLEMLT